MTEKIYEFDAEIKKHPKIDAGFIEFPYNVEKEFGKKGQVKVTATFDGYAYQGSLVKMGHDCHWLGVTKEVRNAIGKHPGDVVHVVLKQDTEPRIVQIPEDFGKVLEENPEANAFFEKLSYTHRREYVRWITGAKKAETRERRLKKAIRMLLDKIKEP